jgi:hypothetical protein
VFSENGQATGLPHLSRLLRLPQHNTVDLCPFGILPSADHSSNFVSDIAGEAAASPRRIGKWGKDKSRVEWVAPAFSSDLRDNRE